MPNAVDVQRLQALVERLLPLSEKQRGELIAAADWNLLVGTIIEIGRAAMAQRADDSVPTHQHPDQVSVGWLDPELRELVTGGGPTNPAVQTEFMKLRRELAALTARIDRLAGDIDTSRVRVDTVAANDAFRLADWERLNRKVGGLEDDRVEIGDLRATLRTLGTEVSRAVEVGAMLQNNGVTIDVAALVDRVKDVEGLREQLTDADGGLLDVKRFESRLKELQLTLVTQKELTEAVKGVRPVNEGGIDRAALLDAARQAGADGAADSVAALGKDLRKDLRKDLATRIETLDISTVVLEQIDPLREDIQQLLRKEFAAGIKESGAKVTDDLKEVVGRRFDAANTALDTRLKTLADSLDGAVKGQVDQRVGVVTDELSKRLAALTESVSTIDTRTIANAKAIDAEITRASTVERDNFSTLDASQKKIDTRVNELDSSVKQRFEVLDTGVTDRITALDRTLVNGIAGLDEKIDTRITKVFTGAHFEVKDQGAGVKFVSPQLMSEGHGGVVMGGFVIPETEKINPGTVVFNPGVFIRRPPGG